MATAVATPEAEFVCRRIADLDNDTLDLLATDPEFYELFWENERAKCADPATGFQYFMRWYASYADAEGTRRYPMSPWDWQWELIEHLASKQHVISVKPRQVGETVIDTHHNCWLLALCSDSALGRVSNISINKERAAEALEELIDILNCLPPGLVSPDEWGDGALRFDGRKCRQTTTMIEFARGSRIKCFPANGAMRGLRGRKISWDEAAHASGSLDQATKILRALWPALRTGGQLFMFSTAQGRSGPGKEFAGLWDRAVSGELDWVAFFVSRFQHPDYSDEWFAKQVAVLGEIGAAQEYPADPEEAFEGDSEGAFVPSFHVGKAVELGRHWQGLADRGELGEPAGGKVTLGFDFGNRGGATLIYPLAAGDLFVTMERASEFEDPENFVRRTLAAVGEQLHGPYGPRQLEVFYDTGGPGKQLSYMLRRVIKEHYPAAKVTPVVFGKVRKLTVSYFKACLERTASGHGWSRLGFAPSCTELTRQVRDGKKAEDGDRIKGDDDVFDSLLAGLAQRAIEHERAKAKASRR